MFLAWLSHTPFSHPMKCWWRVIPEWWFIIIPIKADSIIPIRSYQLWFSNGSMMLTSLFQQTEMNQPSWFWVKFLYPQGPQSWNQAWMGHANELLSGALFNWEKTSNYSCVCSSATFDCQDIYIYNYIYINYLDKYIYIYIFIYLIYAIQLLSGNR